MNPSQASAATQFKVGVFALLGLLLLGAVIFYVNKKPYWWRGCQLVHINVEDATGLKTKSTVRSMGIEIGYLKTVELSETHVRLGICLTVPVEVLPTTRAYLRSEGFLGDKFVELKPVKYVGPKPLQQQEEEEEKENIEQSSRSRKVWSLLFVPEAYAIERPTPEIPMGTRPDVNPSPSVIPHPKRVRKGEKEIPVGQKSEDVQHLVSQVDGLVNEMTNLTNNLKEAINPQELRQTMRQLNKTLENASRTLSPEGGLNTTAQRTLAKLEDAIEQLRDLMTRVNRGEGSVGMLLNDPSYAEEFKEAIKNVNRLLSKVGGVRFVVDVGAEQLRGYDSGRGWFKLGIWPSPDRYYLLGIGMDPRGKRTTTTTTTVAGGITTTSQTTQVEQQSLLLTGMLGKVFWRRIDLSLGVLNNDGVVSTGLWLGPSGKEEIFKITNDIYSRGQGFGLDDRVSLVIHPFSSLYLRGGLESIHQVNGKVPFFYGAGISFDDQDIKLLFAFR